MNRPLGKNMYFYFHEQVHVSEKARDDIDFLTITIHLPSTCEILNVKKVVACLLYYSYRMSESNEHCMCKHWNTSLLPPLRHHAARPLKKSSEWVRIGNLATAILSAQFNLTDPKQEKFRAQHTGSQHLHCHLYSDPDGSLAW